MWLVWPVGLSFRRLFVAQNRHIESRCGCSRAPGRALGDCCSNPAPGVAHPYGWRVHPGCRKIVACWGARSSIDTTADWAGHSAGDWAVLNGSRTAETCLQTGRRLRRVPSMGVLFVPLLMSWPKCSSWPREMPAGVVSRMRGNNSCKMYGNFANWWGPTVKPCEFTSCPLTLDCRLMHVCVCARVCVSDVYIHVDDKYAWVECAAWHCIRFIMVQNTRKSEQIHTALQRRSEEGALLKTLGFIRLGIFNWKRFIMNKGSNCY